MSITQGLFSDVLANAPQAGGSADWSKTLPMAGAVDWTKVSPFQVINPLTGYNFGATQPTQASTSDSTTKAETPQLTEYQKWLAQQSQTSTGRQNSTDRTSGPFGNGTGMSDQDWATTKEMRDFAGGMTPLDKQNMKNFAIMAGGLLTGSPSVFAKGAMEAYNSVDYQKNALENFRNMVSMQQAQQADEAAAAQAIAEQRAYDSAASNFGSGGRTAETIARDAVTLAGGMGKSIPGDTSGMSSVY